MANEIKHLPIDYVTKDYEGFFEMMKEQIPNLTPEWTDTSDTDQGIVILQLLSYGLHVLAYYQDKGVNENLLPYARTKKAILTLSKFLGYIPAKQSPSTSIVTFTKYEEDIDKRILVPQGTQVSTNPETGEPIIFETTEQLFIEVGEMTGEVAVVQGETVLNEVLGRGLGIPNQQFIIPQADAIEDSIILLTKENNNDYFWDLKESLFESKPTDRHYTATINENNQTILTFGDGITGMRIPNGATLQSTYRFGGGKFGDLEVGLINNLYDTRITVIESVTNLVPAIGGQDYESLEVTRAFAPIQYKTGGKIVTATDCEEVAVKELPGVVGAKCIETYNDTNDVHLYLALDTGENMSDFQKTLFLLNLRARMIMNQNLYLFDVPYKVYDLTVTAYIHDNFKKSDVRTELDSVLTDFLSFRNFIAGEEVYLSRIVEQSFFATGVKNVVVNSPVTDVIPTATEIPKLGTLTINIVGGVDQ